MGIWDDIMGKSSHDIEVSTPAYGGFSKIFPNTTEGREQAHSMFDDLVSKGHEATESSHDRTSYQCGSIFDGFFGAGGKK